MNDPDLIRETVYRYFAASDRGDPALLQEAFHPAAMMYRAEQGELVTCSQPQWWERLRQAGPRPATERLLQRIEIAGDSASAILTSSWPTHTFHDAVLLLKLRGRWWIVAKAFYRGPPGEPAQPPRPEGLHYHPRAHTFTVLHEELVPLSVPDAQARLAEPPRLVRADGASNIALVELEHRDRVMDKVLMVQLAEGWRIVGLVCVPVGPGERLVSVEASPAGSGSAAAPRARAG
jgi:hypothetical protein